ncbi:hypothetical protein, partial [Noviherbaspirillum sp.]|uniref:hypothetical protein n=1 Tax=Noviherbaspirillum sp. TaxID=1926288 RepID=UPI0025D93103
ALLLVVMLVYPHEILHNQPLGNKGADVQNNSCYDGRRFLRVAASSNWRINADKNTPHFCRLTWALYSNPGDKW